MIMIHKIFSKHIEKGASLMSLVCIASLSPVIASGADFYVDSSAATGGNGSPSAPFATIKAAVDAANGVPGPSTIHVASGTYAITSANDFVTVSVSNLTIEAENPSEKPVFALDADLSVATNNPVLITVPIDSDYLTVSGLAFTYSYAASKNAAGNTFGEKGCAFLVAANYATFENCTFAQTGTTGSNWQQGGLIRADSDQGNVSKKGTHMTVRDCVFTGFGRSAKDLRPIKVANYGSIYRNVFDSCSGYVYAIKPSAGGYFVSNRVVNCSMPFYSNGDSYGEWRDAEFAYNIFVNSGVGCFYKNSAGFSGEPRFHHNTVIDCSNFITVANVDNTNTDWTPWIFDNLIIASGTGCIIRENATSLAKRKSSFKAGSFFTGNAWLATDFVSGTAPAQFDDYALGLTVSDNKELGVAPEFLDTADPTSPDFYRLNAQRYPWVRTVAQGASGTIGSTTYSYEKTYVGAVEPADIPIEPGEFFEIDGLSMDISTNIVPATANFAISYKGNAGSVTVEWDFEGDGTWDQSGSEVSATWTYAAPGDFYPKVRLTDAVTSKSLVVDLASVIKLRMMDVYVDANAAVGGDGTETAPLRSIAAAVPLCASHGTVHVRSGKDRVYSIETADDLITVTADRYLTITKWGEERAKIVVASTLHSVTNNPSVISIPVGVVHTTISGLDFTYYGSSAKDALDSSLGKWGRCIDVQGNYTTVDDCVFHQSGNYTGSNGSLNYSAPADGIGHAAIATRAHEHDQGNGQHLTVSCCSFLGESDDRSMSAVRNGANALLCENVYSNCCYVLWGVKNNVTDLTMTSNILYRCGTIKTEYGNYGEFRSATFSYNIVWCDSGSDVPFLTKTIAGLNETVLFHHNTIVNASHFAEIENKQSSWHPRIFDNLIVLDPASEDGRTVFKNNQTAFASGNFSSFKTGGDGCLKNNAWYAPGGISGGVATNVPGYDLSKGCEIADNIVLSAPPSPPRPNSCRRSSIHRTSADRGRAGTRHGRSKVSPGRTMASTPTISARSSPLRQVRL